MKRLVKLGVAGALALGGSMAAHATVPVPTSSGNTGDVILWADVFNGTTLVQAYVGDTGITVNSAGGGTLPTGTFTNANLQALLAQVTGSNTIFWVLEGGGGQGANSSPPVPGPAPYFVSSNSPAHSALANPFGVQNGSTLSSWGVGLSGAIANNVNPLVGTGTSALSSNDSSTGGTFYNPNALQQDVGNWYGNDTAGISTSGLGTMATFFRITAANQTTAAQPTYTKLFNATLTANGLVFSPLAAVPLPAALWLLGSGLLGLAGVARRKVVPA